MIEISPPQPLALKDSQERLDLPGHGRSADARDVSGYGLPAYADALVAFASDRGLQDAVFVGWSLGGTSSGKRSPHCRGHGHGDRPYFARVMTISIVFF